jgi:hypothetical protein
MSGVSLRFVPTTSGLSVVSGIINVNTTSATTEDYSPIAGLGSNAASQTNYVLSPFTGGLTSPLILGGLIAGQCPSPSTSDGTDTHRTFTTYVTNVAAAPTVVIPKDISGVVTACGTGSNTMTESPQDNTHFITMGTGGLYSISNSLNSLTNAATASTLKWSMFAVMAP